MQLDKIVRYHKALADPTRVRMLILLADGERNGLELAEKLGISAATVTHHAAKLREASLIHERRDKNTIYFSLDRYFIRAHATAVVDLIEKRDGEEELSMDDKNERLKQSVLKNFFAADGRLKHIPAQLKKKLIVMEHLASGFEPGRKYAEKEINESIKRVHDDYATIRREFIMHQYMYRDNEVYELNPRRMWTKWETLS
ncbi:metalloregulator ArsR/SmtB family transcription factor [Paenibacillus flagellatus]|uniref:ArsR family transcriptional regulator n=1 Tax=Paenibacillus flagellatus TaxID=2211139 RepID=A0A2V5JWF3_9BACL|nr:metalloregulator ArsR/SmtB family transcription factor [Paenibacillus flagellatus]PYI51028.1 ArsR family transcriptional regulator [Paenibacillus flagellatus]